MNILKRKFILLTVLVSLAFSACNIYPAKIIRKVNNSGSIFSSILNAGFFLAILAVPFLIYAHYNKNNFALGQPGKGKPGTDKSGTDKSGKRKSGAGALGPEIDLAEHIKDCTADAGRKNYKKIDNVEYIQLKTVNQGNKEITDAVKPKYDSTVDGDGKWDQNFDPGATCGSQSLRNAYFLSRALSTQDIKDKRDMFRAMDDIENAKINLENIIGRGETTSSLENTDVVRRLSAITLNDGSGRKLNESVTVIDTVQMVESGAIDNVIAQFRTKDNFYHVFIVSTGDVYSMTGFDDFMDNVKIKLGKDIDAQEIAGFRESNKGGHWYTIAIEKRGRNAKCMIADTGGSPDHVIDTQVDERARFLCEFILNGFASFNFREIMVDRVAHLFEVRIEEKKKEQDAKINANKPANTANNGNSGVNTRVGVNTNANNNRSGRRGNGRRKRH